MILSPVARFSKVPNSKLFGRILGAMVLFVSSKRRRLKARILVVISIFLPLTKCEKTSFTAWVSRSFRNGFSGPKRFRDFEERVHWYSTLNGAKCNKNHRATTTNTDYRIYSNKRRIWNKKFNKRRPPISAAPPMLSPLIFSPSLS